MLMDVVMAQLPSCWSSPEKRSTATKVNRIPNLDEGLKSGKRLLEKVKFLGQKPSKTHGMDRFCYEHLWETTIFAEENRHDFSCRVSPTGRVVVPFFSGT